MLIEPNSTVKLLSGVPLDNSYEHTLWFANATLQYNYFSSRAVKTVNNMTYQRYNKGSLKLGYTADSLYACNYLMFQNTGFGNKWFYAFITDITYLSNETCQINYEIDVMQTWLFEHDLKQCYVEREHSVTDIVGEHTLPENVEKGPYITTATIFESASNSIGYMVLFSEWLSNIAVDHYDSRGAITDTEIVEAIRVEKINGLAFPCYYFVADNTKRGCELISGVIDWYNQNGKVDALVGVFGYPKNLITPAIKDAPVLVTMGIPNKNLGAYTPKNNKLYTYPYCCLTVEGGSQAVELRYELFNGNNPTLYIKGVFEPSPSVVCYPHLYAGKTDDFTQVITINGFPILPTIKDNYQNWIAQNKSKIVSSELTSVAKGVIYVGMAAGGHPFGLVGAVSSFGQVADSVTEVTKQSALPDTLNGSINATNPLMASGELGFRACCKTLRPEYLSVIDDYFTRFGYATKRTKVPNRTSRPHFNYVKTISANVTGNVPAIDLNKIIRIYDNGVTFWKNPSEVGNYSVDNRP